MTVRDAIQLFQISQKNIHRKRTKDSYRYLLEHLGNHFADIHVEVITPDHIHQFLESLTEHLAKSTRRLRYAQLGGWFSGRRIPVSLLDRKYVVKVVEEDIEHARCEKLHPAGWTDSREAVGLLRE